MHSAPLSASAASSSSSSSQSLSYPNTLSAEPYSYNPMSTYSSYPSLSATSGSREGEEELDEDGLGEDVMEDEHDKSRGSRDSSREMKEGVERRKPRITLARGGACVVCRTRKLKCTGERPCKSCEKAGHECRYEEVQRRKPKAVVLDERLAELERILGLLPGEPIENLRKRGLQPSPSITSQVREMSLSHTSPSIATPMLIPSASSSSGPSPLPQLHRDLIPTSNQLNGGSSDIPANSSLEFALISLVLPHTPYLLMPVHPERFMALLTLPANDPSRPHPALLYILFTEAVLILERGTPSPNVPRPPFSLFPHSCTPPMPNPSINFNAVLQHMRGRSPSLLERARSELDSGIRNVDRPFDLVRAAVGIARHLYSLGRFIEGWNIPVSRLVVSCGLHRLSGNFTPPDGHILTPPGHVNPMPRPYAPAHYYPVPTQCMSAPDGCQFPVLRMKPVILPPARDEIEVAERTATFWAAKMQDWAAGVGWGWSTALADEECTTEWPWGNAIPEPKVSPMMNQSNHRFGIRDLHNPASIAHASPLPETTYTLAMNSVALLHRASHLFDLPTSTNPPGRGSSIPPLSAIEAVDRALRMLRDRIPQVFGYPRDALYANHSGSISPHDNSIPETYDGMNDPWFVLLHSNLFTAEMMMWKEMAHHQVGAYERAVGCARAMVAFIRRMRAEHWVHVDMTVALDLSLCSRFLFKESERLRLHGELKGSAMAAEEAESLRQALKGEYCRWMPMASLHGLIVQRVREGWSEKEGEYERI